MSNWLWKTSGTGSATQVNSGPQALRIQTSIDGKPIPFGYGKQRIPGNLIWVGSQSAYPPSQVQSSSGGKGGVLGMSNQSTAGTTEITYSTALTLALCEGPIAGPPIVVWYNKGREFWTQAQQQVPSINATTGQFDMTLVAGDYSQGASQDGLHYRGIAYVFSAPMFLGSSNDIPNLTFDIPFGLTSSIAGLWGVIPSVAIQDFLTNQFYGLGFPSARIGSNSLYDNYCLSLTLILNALVADQKPASEYLTEWATASNSEYVWSGGLLKIIPYGDEAVGSYVPPSPTPYTLTDNDYIVTASTPDPVVITRLRIEDKDNSVTIEYIDGENGNNDYNPATVNAKNDAAIQVYGIKIKSTITLHCITSLSTATTIAQLILGREAILNTYNFTVPQKYILLDPMDIITINDSTMGVQNLLVRIKEITENDDYSLSIVAEDYLAGTASSPAVTSQIKNPFGVTDGTGVVDPNARAAVAATHNLGILPGNVATPFIFEPTYQVKNGLYIYVAVAGQNMTTWGGCDIYVSTDGANYSKVGTQVGPSRYGVNTSFFAPGGGQTSGRVQGAIIDNITTLGVDLTISQGSLPSSTQTDMLAGSSLMYFDGEFFSYQNSTPTGTYTFNLTTLNRGLYGSPVKNHFQVGLPIARVDDHVAQAQYDQTLIGSTIYFKFLSFNKTGGGRQSLSDVGSFPYTIQGTSFTSQVSNPLASYFNAVNISGTVQFNLPVVQNFTANYIGTTAYLDWDTVQDSRQPIAYQIRKGATFATGTIVGTYFHSHVPAPGNDTYWIAAVCYSPAGAPGAIFYSSAPSSVVVPAATLPSGLNLLASFDETVGGLNGFTGTLDNTITKPVQTPRTVSAGNPVVLAHFDPV